MREPYLSAIDARKPYVDDAVTLSVFGHACRSNPRHKIRRPALLGLAEIPERDINSAKAHERPASRVPA
jgi:hypothetical protein